MPRTMSLVACGVQSPHLEGLIHCYALRSSLTTTARASLQAADAAPGPWDVSQAELGPAARPRPMCRGKHSPGWESRARLAPGFCL